MPHFLNEPKELIENVSKKQKTTVSHLTQQIDNLIQCIEQCKNDITANATTMDNGHDTESDHSNKSSTSGTTDKSREFAVATTKIATQIQKCYRNFQVAHKEYHSTLTKYGKSLDKCMKSNQEDALLRDPWQVNHDLLNQIIAQHLFREGYFEVAQIFERETNVQLTESFKQCFMDMFLVLKQLEERDTSLALEWCCKNGRQYSRLAFMCHKLQYIRLLSSSDRKTGIEAMKYARTHLSPFSTQPVISKQQQQQQQQTQRTDTKHSSNNPNVFMNEIKFLMGALLYAGRLHESDHYQSLLDESLWDEVKQLFREEFSKISNQASDSPLYVSVTAGTQALPTLLKMISVTRLDRESLQKMEQLAVELDGVDQMFHFHSIFACPVSKENYLDPDNPPMLLPCGHVLIKNSILKLVRGAQQRFKCPYCPVETTVTSCKIIYF